MKHDIIFTEDGHKICEWFHNENGEEHRDPLEGPAHIGYDMDGNIVRKFYFSYDKLHNPYGLAWINVERDEYFWCFNGDDLTDEVNQYLKENNLDHKTMAQTDFNIMWTCIL